MDPESELLVQAKNGKKSALEVLYKTNFKYLHIFVRTKVNDIEITNDICSEAFVRAFENIDKFREESKFKSWLYTIAKNLIYDWYKEKSKSSIYEEFMDIEVKIHEEKQDDKKDTSEIKKILGALKDNYREVLELRFLSKLSIKETSQVMGLSESNIKVIQNRAIKKAQSLFKQ